MNIFGSNTMRKVDNPYVRGVWALLERETRNSHVKLTFSSANDGATKIRFLHQLLKEKNSLPPASYISQPKNDSASLAARNEGNVFFKIENYVSALEYCFGNRSIALAPVDSENLAIGYANRSAVYLNAGFYKFCLENIELALKNNYPEKLKPKLEQRRKECLELMNKGEDNLERCKKKMLKEKFPVKLSYPADKRIPIMIDGLEYVKSDQFGRGIRTKRDLFPGKLAFCWFV